MDRSCAPPLPENSTAGQAACWSQPCICSIALCSESMVLRARFLVWGASLRQPPLVYGASVPEGGYGHRRGAGIDHERQCEYPRYHQRGAELSQCEHARLPWF